MSGLRTVGILGGMGPQATILLQQKLLDSVEARDDCEHIPLIVDVNTQVPSRLDWILHNRGNNPGPVLAEMARGLEQAGAQALAMPCNTAHHFAPEIQQAVTIPFLNMLEMVAAKAASVCTENGKVGILASPATRTIKLFDQALQPHGLETVWPDSSFDMLQPILEIKSRGVTDESRVQVQMAAENCTMQGADCLLVGCTEFSLLSNSLVSGAPVIDSIDLLVNRINQFSIQN